MNLKFFANALGSTSILFLFIQSGYAGTFDKLGGARQQAILSGQQVVFESRDPKYPDSPWPRTQVYEMIRASPEEAAAVFFDFKTHKTYFPDMLESKVTPTGKNTVDVYYSVKLPFFLGIENHTVHDTLIAEQGIYEIRWVGVPNSNFDYSEGSAHFEPLGQNTLLIYTSSIDPIRIGSGLPWAVSAEKEHLLGTVRIIQQHIEQVKTTNPTLIQTEIQDLRKAVIPDATGVNELTGHCI